MKPRVMLIGAVSQNRGVVGGLAEAFRLGPEELFVPEEYAWMGAIGCALLERSRKGERARKNRGTPAWRHAFYGGKRIERLSLDNVVLLRNHPEASRTEPLPDGGEKISTYLGIDVGSVSTNLALLDERGCLLHGIYLRTSGRPIEVSRKVCGKST